jgi:hypothetical protein
MPSVIAWIHGTMASSYACRLPKAGGLSGETMAVPAVIVNASPPLAFSTWYIR